MSPMNYCMIKEVTKGLADEMLRMLYIKLIPTIMQDNVHSFAYAKNIINCTLIALVAVPSYAIVYYYLNFPTGSVIVLITGIFILAASLLLKPLNSLALSRALIVAPVFLCLTSLTYFIGGIFSPTIFWLILPPMLGIILGSTVSAFFWALLSIFTILLFYFLSSLHIGFPTYAVTNLLFLQMFSLCGLVLIILFLSYFFERGRKEGALEIQITNQKLVIANQVKSEFLSNISHELLTPLNGIIGFTELLQTGKVDTQHSKEFLEDILVSSDHLVQIINNILDISNIEAGRIEFHPSSVNLAILINEIKEIFRHVIQDKQIKLNVRINPFLSSIYLDPIKLKQILYHLLANAVKFTEPHGKIEIDVKELNGIYFCIEISDSGIGIRPDDLQKIFNKFEQLDSSMGKRYGGLGVGLYIVRRIVEAQGGKVTVESFFGKGSKFIIMLPKHYK